MRHIQQTWDGWGRAVAATGTALGLVIGRRGRNLQYRKQPLLLTSNVSQG